MKLSGAALRKFLAKPEAHVGAALIYGPNSGFVSEAVKKIAMWALGGTDDPYATTRLSEDELKRDSARLSDALSAQSLLGGPTLVHARIDGKSADASLLAALADIEAGAPMGFLLIEGGELSASSEVVKAFNNAKRAVAAGLYEESEAERASAVRELAEELGVTFSRDGMEAALSALPPDRALVRREMEKLAAYAHGRDEAIGAEDITLLITSENDSAIDAASLAAVSGKPWQAVEALARIDALSGVSALRALERRMMQLSDLRALVDGGASPSDAVQRLRPPVFWKERDAMAAQSRAWTAKKLSAAFDVLWTAELRAKTAGAPQEIIAADAYKSVASLVGR